MMRKKIVSLCMALVLCLGLLPVTALAAEEIKLFIGGQQITENGCYENRNGTWTKVDGTEPANGQFYYDAATFTLTLNKAEITNNQTVNVAEGYTYDGSVIAFSQTADVSLKIVVSQGTSTITGTGGIRVESTTGNASLSIKGSGSLDVEPKGSNSGITLCSSKNTNLDINGADVTASSPAQYGVYLISSTDASSTSTIMVNNGSLTTGGNGNVGIYYYWSGTSNAGTSSLTVSGNAVVDTRNSQIMAQDRETVVQVGAGSDGNGGIVFNGKNGTVYGKVELQDDLTINEGESLTIPDGASLTIPDGASLTIGNDATLTNEGTVTTTGNGTLTNNGKIENSGTLPDNIQGTAPPSITTTSLDGGAVGTAYSSVTLSATGSPTSWAWSAAADSNTPPGLTLNNDGTITGTPTAAGTYSFTVTATNDYGSDSKEFTLTIDQQGTIHVTSVSLDKTSLELTEGETAQLTATVKPDNATNKNVTWSSSAPNVATVDSSGKVTAVAPGTATITVTTADGGFTATCAVTVRPDIPPANPNYRITVEATQGGAVTTDPTAAKAGTTVTLTPVPDRGYQVGSVAVTDRFGEAVAVTENADGTYTFTMPNGQVTVTVTFEQAPLPFHDVTEGDWFYDAVRYAYETGLMDGVEDSLFAPNSETTRAQLVTILYRLAGEPEPGGDSGFTDVEADTWYTDAVAWAAQNGIVNGVSDTEFAPGDDITREQLAVILYRYAAYQGYDVSQRADLSGFGDASSISGYAQEALSWAHAQGLVLGFEDGSLRPQGTASRAQIAAVLMRFLAAVSAE